MNNKKFNASSVRLMRFLYSLGFDKTSYTNLKGEENWLFDYTPELQEALDFYFQTRRKNREKQRS